MDENESRDTISFRLLFLILIVLLFFTAVTVTVSKSNTGSFGILTALTIASVKAAFVLWFFMHLRSAGRLVIIGFITTIVILVSVIGFTFLDIAYR